ncbi:MAG TPA: DUF192 domain-containing protein [Actinomycetota bacterium]|nr:DUF192 domain-containing protein [Actinomycetota bacterium]
MRKVLAVAAILVALASCYRSDPDPKPSSTALPKGSVLIDTDEGSVLIQVEVAETEQAREKGLMDRRSLPDDRGMLFTFPQPTRGAFWMKDTLIPLSIAFIDQSSTIVSIQDMDPCRTEPCPTYAPDADYNAALEVNQGAFERWGVNVGDRVTLSRTQM